MPAPKAQAKISGCFVDFQDNWRQSLKMRHQFTHFICIACNVPSIRLLIRLRYVSSFPDTFQSQYAQSTKTRVTRVHNLHKNQPLKQLSTLNQISTLNHSATYMYEYYKYKLSLSNTACLFFWVDLTFREKRQHKHRQNQSPARIIWNHFTSLKQFFGKYSIVYFELSTRKQNQCSKCRLNAA